MGTAFLAAAVISAAGLGRTVTTPKISVGNERTLPLVSLGFIGLGLFDCCTASVVVEFVRFRELSLIAIRGLAPKFVEERMPENPEMCPQCNSPSLYAAETNVRGGHGPDLLPGLGGFFQGVKFLVVVCSECGATQFFADEKSRAKLAQSEEWQHL